MNFRTKNLKRFLLALIGFTICFWFFFRGVLGVPMRIFVSLGISLLLSTTMFYDPKKYYTAKKKAEQADLENTNLDKTDSN